jgi:hypothetical protein
MRTVRIAFLILLALLASPSTAEVTTAPEEGDAVAADAEDQQ